MHQDKFNVLQGQAVYVLIELHPVTHSNTGLICRSCQAKRLDEKKFIWIIDHSGNATSFGLERD